MRERLTSAVARLEHLRQRNDAQRRQLRAGAAKMGDEATAAVERSRDQIEAGDPDAVREGRRALFGRTVARRLLADEDA